MNGSLNGILVLDLTWILSGPYCTMILGDQGAEIIKIERPGIGDGARGTGPFVNDDSAYFMNLNRNKLGLTLDLSTEEGKSIFLRLADCADVVVENFRPGTMKSLGLDHSSLMKRNPQLIYCAISGFGMNGPYGNRSALDAIVQGMGGIMSITGDEGGDPVRIGSSIGDITAGLYATIGILSALHERASSNLGQLIDLSMLDCQVSIQENAIGRFLATGEVPVALGTRHPSATPFQAFPTIDGWIVIAIFGGASPHWPLLCSALNHVELIDDQRFESSWERTLNRDQLIPLMSEVLRTKTTQDWLDELVPLGIPCGPVNSIDQVINDPQVEFREMIVERKHDRLGTWKYVNTPIKMSRSQGGIYRNPPDLGGDSREILTRLLGLSNDEIDNLENNGII